MNEDGESGNHIVYNDKTVFQEEEMNEDGESGNDIVYDDKTVAALLDRSQEGIEEKESWANEYLSSFKVILQGLFTQFWEFVSEYQVTLHELKQWPIYNGTLDTFIRSIMWKIVILFLTSMKCSS